MSPKREPPPPAVARAGIIAVSSSTPLLVYIKSPLHDQLRVTRSFTECSYSPPEGVGRGETHTRLTVATAPRGIIAYSERERSSILNPGYLKLLIDCSAIRTYLK